MKNWLAGMACLLAASTGYAMTWQELEAEINSVESGNPQNMQIIARFSDMVQMLVTYNKAERDAGNSKALFCPPPNGSLQLNEVVSMVRAEVRRKAAAQDALVQELLLASFSQRYPCD